MNHELSESMKGRKRVVSVVAVLIITAFAAITQAEGPAVSSAGRLQVVEPARRDAWEFNIVPYIWALSETGNVTVKGFETDVDAAFKDMISNLNGALMLDFEVRKGRFGGFINPFFASVGGEESFQILFQDITVDAAIDILVMEAGVCYRLGPYPLGKRVGRRKTPTVTVYPYIGGRYTDLDVKLDVTRFRRIAGTTTGSSYEDGKDWTDPIFGARILWDLYRRWSFAAGGNIGGFGVGSDFAWMADIMGGYRFRVLSKQDNASVFFGYRALYQDYTEGSGADLFEYKTTMHGPIVGVSFGF